MIVFSVFLFSWVFILVLLILVFSSWMCGAFNFWRRVVVCLAIVWVGLIVSICVEVLYNGKLMFVLVLIFSILFCVGVINDCCMFVSRWVFSFFMMGLYSLVKSLVYKVFGCLVFEWFIFISFGWRISYYCFCFVCVWLWFCWRCCVLKRNVFWFFFFVFRIRWGVFFWVLCGFWIKKW